MCDGAILQLLLVVTLNYFIWDGAPKLISFKEPMTVCGEALRYEGIWGCIEPLYYGERHKISLQRGRLGGDIGLLYSVLMEPLLLESYSHSARHGAPSSAAYGVQQRTGRWIRNVCTNFFCDIFLLQMWNFTCSRNGDPPPSKTSLNFHRALAYLYWSHSTEWGGPAFLGARMSSSDSAITTSA